MVKTIEPKKDPYEYDTNWQFLYRAIEEKKKGRKKMIKCGKEAKLEEWGQVST